MELLVHNLLSQAKAAVAMAIIIWTSAVLVQSLDRFAPMYLKLVTFYSFLPFMVMSALVVFMLLTMISMRTFILYAPALLVLFCSSLLIPSMRSMSSWRLVC
ncbi:hypothetical protein DPMN_006302 [Dreissena polymorpha]|uniref:Uncharacterized protein n=1 Tax=Dreissena polymorpha TaxID=45954 RepID=A0A9D4MTS1_DREPO|nr:hypothetical protein DPMN_006302 [Dreissena polymorpha]